MVTERKEPDECKSDCRKLDNNYTLDDVERRSIYRDISMLQYCGYKIKQCKDKRKG